MENTNTKWKTIEPQIWKPENEGDTIEGILVNKKEGLGLNESNAYYVENKEGIFMIWGSTVLDDRMSVVGVGTLVRIEFKGKKPSKKGNDVKIFSVSVSEQVLEEE